MRIKTETSVGLFVVISCGLIFYLTFMIGLFRLDTANYHTYTMYFRDVSGLMHRANVTIAGVKVGWVEDVTLAPDGDHVTASVRVSRDYTLYENAYGMVRQDGLLGTKYLELVPGTSQAPRLSPGGVIMAPNQDSVSMDDVMVKVQDITNHVQGVTQSLENVFGGEGGADQLQKAVAGFHEATQRISAFASSIEQTVKANEETLGSLVANLNEVSNQLRSDVPRVSQKVNDAAEQIQNSVEGISEPLEDVSNAVRDGKGVLGTLVNDEEMKYNVNYAVHGIKDYCQKVDRLSIIFDPHGESMYGCGNGLNFEDAKGYFNIRVHPTHDYFYMLGLVPTQHGYIQRYRHERRWFDNDGKEIRPENIQFSDKREKLRFAPVHDDVIRYEDTILYNAQFGKTFDRLALRAGIFDSTFGVGVDYDIPLDVDGYRWITSFEAFDFSGRNRIDDTNAHLKWLNKLFITDTVYTVFGVDDFISRTNKNAFFGFGMRFADDDIKYVASYLPVSPT